MGSFVMFRVEYHPPSRRLSSIYLSLCCPFSPYFPNLSCVNGAPIFFARLCSLCVKWLFSFTTRCFFFLLAFPPDPRYSLPFQETEALLCPLLFPVRIWTLSSFLVRRVFSGRLLMDGCMFYRYKPYFSDSRLTPFSFLFDEFLRFFARAGVVD